MHVRNSETLFFEMKSAFIAFQSVRQSI